MIYAICPTPSNPQITVLDPSQPVESLRTGNRIYLQQLSRSNRSLPQIILDLGQVWSRTIHTARRSGTQAATTHLIYIYCLM